MVIINGKIFPMEGENIANGFVRVHESKIAALGDMSDYQKVKGEEVLDVQGAWVLPGLIESHAHIGITEEKWGTIGDDCNEETLPVTPTLRAIDAINPMDPAFHDAIGAGITSVMVGPDLTARSKIEVKNMDFKTNKILHDAGVLFSITTDHPVSLIQYLPLCAGLAVKHGLPVEEGFKAITINAARICRVDDRVGSLKKGKDADIAIFSGNPLEVFTETLYTIIDGQVIYNKEQSRETIK